MFRRQQASLRNASKAAWAGLLLLSCLLLPRGLRASADSTELISFTAQALQGTWCPGDPVKIDFQMCNTNQYSVQGGKFYVMIEDTTNYPTADCILANVGDIYQWMAVGSTGALNPPSHNFAANWGASPAGGGYNAGLTVPLACKDFSFTFPLPPDLVYGRTYRILVKGDDNYVSDNSSPCDFQTINFTTCTPSCSATLKTRVEGTADNNELMLFVYEYDFSNSTANKVKAALPACATIQEISPGTYSQAGQTVTWTIPDATAGSSPVPYRQTGEEWILVKLNGCPAGNITSTGQYSDNCSGGFQNSNTVSVPLGGGLNVTLSKRAYDSAWLPMADGINGDVVHYVLEYNVSGSGLRCFDSFNTLTTGATYTAGTGTPAPPNWIQDPEATNAQWKVLADATGNKWLQYQNNNQYKILNYNCPAANVNGGEDFCGGMVQSDVRIDGNASNGDISIVLRSDGTPQPDGYWVILSVDPAPAGNLMLQKNTAGNPAWPAAGAVTLTPNGPLFGTWYTVKVLEQPLGTFRIKYWQRGQPEPTGWMVTYTDPSPFPCGTAGDGIAWRPGISGHNDLMSYDNFKVFSAASVTGAQIWDTIPAGVDYTGTPNTPLGSTPSGSGVNEGNIRWDFTGSNFGAVGGVLYEGTGSFTWNGVLDCSENADPVLNQAFIKATGISTQASQIVSIDLTCGTPTSTVTRTRTPTPTLTRTPTPSFTATRTATPSLTASPTRTDTRTATLTFTPSVTYTATRTPTPTFTRTVTPTNTPTFTLTSTRTATPTRTVTPSVTYTNTLGSTPTYTVTLTPTPTRTATPTFTRTATITFTRTATPTFTPSVTHSPTQSPGPSATSTFTRTVTPTFTPSSTITFTRTATPTFTPSSTNSPTQSPGPSPTSTFTRTATPTFTLTSTITFTRTATPTYTPSSTDSPTQSPGPSPTDTFTRTVTPTYTPTFTVTFTPTATSTYTLTSTDSPTQSPGPSPTDTFTRTATPTFTPTFTLTATPSVTPSFTDTPSDTPTFTVTSTRSNTPQNTPSSTPTWTLTATPTATRTHTPTATLTFTPSITFTHSPTATPTFTQTVTATHTPTVTQSYTYTVSPTVTPTPIPMPHQVTLAAYNEAGELVKIIYQGPAQYLPGDLQLSAGTIIGGQAPVVISFPGVFATGSNQVSWDADNNSGQLIVGGVYTIKAQIVDNFGEITSLIKTVQVIPGGPQQSLRIYNSAGEMVRSIILSSPVSGATRLGLLSASYALEINPSTGQATKPFAIDVLGKNGTTSTSWDGLNDRGLPVNSGTYTLQLVSTEGDKETVVTARSISVLKAAEAMQILDSAVLGPNPVTAGLPATLFYDPTGLMGHRCAVRVYNLAGELVGNGDDPSLSGKIDLGLARAQASGIYLVRFEVLNGSALLQARTLKLAVVH